MSSIKKVNSRPSTGSGNHRRGTTGGSSSGRSVGVITPTTKGQTGPRTTGGKEISLLEYGVNNKLDNMYSGMLDHNAGSNPFAQLLASLGIDEDRWLNQDQRADWNKQLMDAQLQYYQDLEKRQYTQEQLNEQRVYDSPLNQLARLMGAGVSRDAAIAMLSGQAGQPTIAESAVNTPGTTASESRNAGVERALGIANAVFNGVSALSSLVGLGFSVPQAIFQTKLLKGTQYLQQKDIQALSSTDKAFSILNAAGMSADAFGSATTAISSIEELAKKGNADALQFIASGGVSAIRGNASLSSNRFKSLGGSEREYENTQGMYFATMDKMAAETDLAKVQADALGVEMKNTEAEYEQICAQTDFIKQNTETIKGQAEVFKQQAALLEKQGKTEDAKQLLIAAQTLEKDLENKKTQAVYNATAPRLEFDGSDRVVVQRTGLEWMTYGALHRIISDATLAQQETNPEFMRVRYLRMFSDANTIAMANALEQLKLQAGIDFAHKYPQQAAAYSALEKLGVYQYLHAIAEGNYDFNAGINFFGLDFGVNKHGNTAVEYLYGY